MSYISKIREKVGHDPLISVAAGVIIENEKEEILLQMRSDTKNFGTPGGNIELGEKLTAAAIREVYEETGLILKDLQLFGIYSGKICIMQYPNQDVVSYVNIIFYAKVSSTLVLKHDEESEYLQYFSRENLPTNIKESDSIWISKWKNKNFDVAVD